MGLEASIWPLIILFRGYVGPSWVLSDSDWGVSYPDKSKRRPGIPSQFVRAQPEGAREETWRWTWRRVTRAHRTLLQRRRLQQVAAESAALHRRSGGGGGSGGGSAPGDSSGLFDLDGWVLRHQLHQRLHQRQRQCCVGNVGGQARQLRHSRAQRTPRRVLAGAGGDWS